MSESIAVEIDEMVRTTRTFRPFVRFGERSQPCVKP